jgi:hypothetical protein
MYKEKKKTSEKQTTAEMHNRCNVDISASNLRSVSLMLCALTQCLQQSKQSILQLAVFLVKRHFPRVTDSAIL